MATANWQEIAGGIRATTDGRETWFVIDNVPSLSNVFDVKRSPANRRQQNQENRERGATFPDRSRYFGLSSEPEADAMFQQGWPEGLARVEKLVAEVAPEVPPAPNIRRVPQWRKAGGTVNVQRWLRQDPAMFRRGIRQSMPSSTTVSVAFSWGGNAGLDSEAMTWAGVAALAATQMLEAAGYNVGLAAVVTNGHNSGGNHVSILHLKGTGEAVSMGHLAAAVAHQASYRLNELRLTQWCPDALGSGYGHHVRLTEAKLDQAKALGILEQETFMVGTIRTEADAIAELRRLVTQLQGDLLA